MTDLDSAPTAGGVAPAPRLRRRASPPPVRIVHLGLGAFSRSHTAWYTAAASDADQWGIAAYAGRRRELADALTEQDGLYALIERSAAGDSGRIVGSISRAHAGDDVAALVDDLAATTTAVVTLTITEAGYRLDALGDGPDLTDPAVMADLAEIERVIAGELEARDARPQTAPGRLILGLEERRRRVGGPLAIVSCDNLPDNGGRLARGLAGWAEAASPALRRWIDTQAAFVSTSVDRITPAIADAERQALAAEYGDAVPVVAEPFHDWVLSGDFPAGRPRWESAGARFVDDLESWEARKLWLLNGAHTLLACLGSVRGHATVAQAIADPVCRTAVSGLWDEDERHLPRELDIPAYREALLARFENPRIEHRLAQIAQDTRTKLRLRIAPVAERERERGGRADGCALAFAAWVRAERLGRIPLPVSAVALDDTTALRQWVHAVSPALGADEAFVSEVERALSKLEE
ncbi:mannitol dehydrogenase family protein [Microbacterium sp. NPDC089189]|uniref:mannitol dehydrogenase family protein n=1 Tax=Microbacterium sp. NPDC089189 TaxID=3154972 RepID=UPI0034352A73